MTEHLRHPGVSIRDLARSGYSDIEIRPYLISVIQQMRSSGLPLRTRISTKDDKAIEFYGDTLPLENL